jgi:DNA-binding CsgD family transcriptional regulator
LEYFMESGDVSQAVAVAAYSVTPSLGLAMDAVGTLPGLTVAATLIKKVLALVPADSYDAARLLAAYGLSIGLISREKYQTAQDAFDRAIAIAEREGDAALKMRTLKAAIYLDLWQGPLEAGLEKSLRAIELASEVEDIEALELAYWAGGMAAFSLGDLEQAERLGAAGLDLTEKLRNRHSRIRALWAIEAVYRSKGEWAQARHFSDRVLGEGLPNPYHLATRIMMEYQVGNAAEGEVYLERLLELMRLMPLAPSGEYAYTAFVIPLIARITGDTSRLSVADAAAEAVLTSPTANVLDSLITRLGAALMAVHREDATSAGEHYAALRSEEALDRMIYDISTDRVLALLAQTMDKLEDSIAHFEEALAILRKGGYRVELAWTCYDYANLCYERREREKALSLLDEALVVATKLGMTPLMEKVNALKAKAAATPGAGSTYPDGLTKREVEVLQLIAAGKSNPEIANELVVSVRTVTTHVTNIFNKTGAANRAQVVIYATRHSLVE